MVVALRLISLVLVVSALMLMGADLVTSLEKDHFVITVRSLEQVWELFSKTGAANFKAWAAHALPGGLAHLVDVILGFWAFAVIGVPGIVLAFLFGRRVADIG